MTPRQILLSLAALLFLGGLFLGLRSHSVTDPFDEQSFDCGSVLRPNESVADIQDRIGGSDFNGDCKSKVSNAKPLAFGALGLGGVALIAAFLAPVRTEQRGG